jgi:hydroxymethylpyrimidine/phosphomethylpyrimidine kinase
MLPIVFSIAGSDCSGGAGIQADLKTISALGGYAAAAITAVTVQNTLGVQSVAPMAPSVIAAQVEAVMSDLRPQAVKIGMIPDAASAAALVQALRPYGAPTQLPVVCDPVMISTSGRRLMAADTVAVLTSELFPLCRLITPNLPEAEALSGTQLPSVEAMEQAGRALAARFGCAVLVKGGHLSGREMCDVLCHQDLIHFERFTSPRVETPNLHGTGCTLSSAIATYLASGHSLSDAVRQAKAYVQAAILRGRALHVGSGNGPLGHFEGREGVNF